MYNLLSLIFGIFAIVVAAVSMKKRGNFLLSNLSWLFCGTSLLCQLLDINHLAKRMDSSAIYDTTPARTIAALALLTAITTLSLAALLRNRQQL